LHPCGDGYVRGKGKTLTTEDTVGHRGGARERDAKNSALAEPQWKDALEALKNEDHYVVMCAEALGGILLPETSTRGATTCSMLRFLPASR
jgi:hypothetical protein